MRGLWDRWRLQLPARSHGLPLLRGPLSLCAACSHPSLMSSPSTGEDGARQPGTFTPSPRMSLLRSSEPATLGTEGICSDLSWLCLVQELELNQIKS